MSTNNSDRKVIPIKKDLPDLPAPEDPNSFESLFIFYHAELMKEEAHEVELKAKLADELKKVKELTEEQI